MNLLQPRQQGSCAISFGVSFPRLKQDTFVSSSDELQRPALMAGSRVTSGDNSHTMGTARVDCRAIHPHLRSKERIASIVYKKPLPT